jgi:acetyl esterase/lipase
MFRPTLWPLVRLCTVCAFAQFLPAAAQDIPTLTDQQTYTLWDKTPGAQGDTPADIPAVQVFLPAEPTGSSFVVCPGGGYGHLANHEGPVIGAWLAKNGVTAFVLRYRLGPKYHHPIQINDAQRALRLVRANAEKWKLDPKRIGIMGFSAGGHLASTASTHFDAGKPDAEDPIDRVSSRPDLTILIYPVISMTSKGHAGSRNNLLGKDPDPALIELLSNENHVTDQTPPAFLVHSTQDKGVPVENSDMYAAALKAHNIPVEFIRGELGGHGFGLKDFWDSKCIAWLRANKF